MRKTTSFDFLFLALRLKITYPDINPCLKISIKNKLSSKINSNNGYKCLTNHKTKNNLNSHHKINVHENGYASRYSQLFVYFVPVKAHAQTNI